MDRFGCCQPYLCPKNPAGIFKDLLFCPVTKRIITKIIFQCCPEIIDEEGNEVAVPIQAEAAIFAKALVSDRRIPFYLANPLRETDICCNGITASNVKVSGQCQLRKQEIIQSIPAAKVFSDLLLQLMDELVWIRPFPFEYKVRTDNKAHFLFVLPFAV